MIRSCRAKFQPGALPIRATNILSLNSLPKSWSRKGSLRLGGIRTPSIPMSTIQMSPRLWSSSDSNQKIKARYCTSRNQGLMLSQKIADSRHSERTKRGGPSRCKISQNISPNDPDLIEYESSHQSSGCAQGAGFGL